MMVAAEACLTPQLGLAVLHLCSVRLFEAKPAGLRTLHNLAGQVHFVDIYLASFRASLMGGHNASVHTVKNSFGLHMFTLVSLTVFMAPFDIRDDTLHSSMPIMPMGNAFGV